MKLEVNKSLNLYWDWLKDKTVLGELENYVEITTPFLDRHNDYLQIYVKRDNDNDEYVLTDEGYILDDLESSGCNIDSPKGQEVLNTMLNGFGVRKNDRALEVNASLENFGISKHNLIQAMLAVNDLFYLASPIVSSLFHEDVMTWLDTSQIRYTPNLKFTGISGYDYRFDFVIPKSENQPERIIRAINRANRDNTQSMTFAWMDTKHVRTAESKAIAILNDTEKPISKSELDAMRNYGIDAIIWSERDEAPNNLAA